MSAPAPDTWFAERLPEDITDEIATYVQDELEYEQEQQYESDVKAFVDDVTPVEVEPGQQHGQAVYDIEDSRLYDVLTTAVERYDDEDFLESVGELAGDGIIKAFKDERRNRPSDTRYRFNGDNVDRTIINGLTETIAANLIAQELNEDYSDTDGIESLTKGLWRNPRHV